MPELLQKVLEQVALTAPRLLGAFSLLVLGWIVARVASAVFRRVLVAVNADALGDKLTAEIDFLRKNEVKIKISQIASAIIYWMLLLMFIVAACDALALQGISEQIQNLINFIPRAVTGMVIFLGGMLLASAIQNVVAVSLKSVGVSSGRMISNVVFYFLLISVAMTALQQTGISTDFIENNFHIILLGIMAAFAIGYGIGSIDTVKNQLGAAYSRRRFKVGDHVKTNEWQGVIVSMDNHSVTLEAEGRIIVVPQKDFSSKAVEVITQ